MALTPAKFEPSNSAPNTGTKHLQRSRECKSADGIAKRRRTPTTGSPVPRAARQRFNPSVRAVIDLPRPAPHVSPVIQSVECSSSRELQASDNSDITMDEQPPADPQLDLTPKLRNLDIAGSASVADERTLNTNDEVEPRKLTPNDINDKIEKRLRERASDARNTSGLIYIAKVASEDGLYKVGSTVNTALGRMDQIEDTCGLQLRVEYRSERRMAFHMRAEKLTHDELHYFCRPFVCPSCGAKHTEYFKLSIEEIEAVVRRWERFLHQQPYQPSGHLHAFWEQRLNAHVRPPKAEAHDHHTQRDERWAKFVNCTDLDRLLYKMTSTRAWIATNYQSADFWKKPILFLWAITFLLTWWDNGFSGHHTTARVVLEILQALPFLLISSRASNERGKTRRRRSGV